jgi:hypothetical protein
MGDIFKKNRNSPVSRIAIQPSRIVLMPTSGKKRASDSTVAKWATVLLSVVFLLAGAWFLYQCFSGGAFFSGTGSTYTGEITHARDATAHPYSADQWLFLPLGLLPFGLFAALLVGRKRSAIAPLIGFFALETLISVAILVTEIVWAAGGRPYSNYLPHIYHATYVTPIAIAAIYTLVSAAVTGFIALGPKLLSRRTKRRPRV